MIDSPTSTERMPQDEAEVRRCPVDGTPLQRTPLPQPGRSRTCPTCHLWWA